MLRIILPSNYHEGNILTDIVWKPTDLSQPTDTTLVYKENIHYLRGIAALFVMLFHAGHYYNRAYNDAYFKHLFSGYFGLYGVAIFFSISGFLMATLVQKQTTFGFLGRRLIRIFPLFLIVTALTLYFRAYPGYNIASLSLAPIGKTVYPLLVEWTLVHEIFFYVALFFLSLMGKTALLSKLAVFWIVAITLNALGGWFSPKIGYATIVQLPIMVENAPFALGLLIPLACSLRIGSLLPFAFFVLTIALVVLVFPISPTIDRLIIGIGSAFLVASAVGSSNILPSFLAKIMNKLGDWSYALYLVHVPIFVIVLGSVGSPSLVMFAFWAVAALCGAALVGELDLRVAAYARRLAFDSRTCRVICTVFVVIYVAVACLYIWR